MAHLVVVDGVGVAAGLAGEQVDTHGEELNDRVKLGLGVLGSLAHDLSTDEGGLLVGLHVGLIRRIALLQ